MEKINNYKSILLNVLEKTNYKRLILCENINGFIYNILTEKGIKFKNYENINFDFLGSLTIDTWNNSKIIEFMLDDIIYADVT